MCLCVGSGYSYEDNIVKCIGSSNKQRNNKEREMGGWRLFDEEWSEISDESTARGIPSLFREQDWG